MIITLLTDFGTGDYFVGAMKGAILSVNPRARIVDLTHEIAPQDVEAGAFTLLAASETFPPGTIHVAVVDPGVGSSRRAVVADMGGSLYVGPDNGLFGYVYERAQSVRVYQLTNDKYFRPTMSTTFHGRDVFAPVAGALSNGVRPEELGALITDYVRLALPSPRRAPDGSLEASVIHVDRFGNCVTNITRADLPGDINESGLRVVVGAREIKKLRRFFAEDENTTPDAREPFAIWGSAGFLELAVNRDSAARLLDIRRGQQVIVTSDE